jgi:hypothetical protein
MEDQNSGTEVQLTPEQKFDKNYLFLTNSLARLGFEGLFDQPLKTAMKLGLDHIGGLQAELQGKDEKMFFTPKFSRNGGDFYFLNSIETTLIKAGQHPITHDFFLYQQKGYDIRQMKNMLEGRSVYSSYRDDGRQVELYRRIDFSAKDERGNNMVRSTYVDKQRFNLEALLSKLPVQGMTHEEKFAILDGLRNGDRVGVTMRQGTNRERLFLEASPHIGTITVFNAAGEKVNVSLNQLRLVGDGQTNTLPDTTKKLIESQEQKQEQGQQQQQGRRKAS